jgi:PAS domain S-box-containing protein
MAQQSQAEQRFEKTLTRVAIGTSVAAAVTGVIYLVAWLTGSMTFRGIYSYTMKANSSLCLILCGAALALAVSRPFSPNRRRLSFLLAISDIIVAGLTMIEFAAGLDLGIDHMLATEFTAPPAAGHPNRMSPLTAADFTICGLAILFLLRDSAPAIRISQALGAVVSLSGLLGFIAHLYGVQGVFGASRWTLAGWPATTAFVVLGGALLCARSREGGMAVVTADDPGGVAIRRLLLPSVAIIIVLGWLHVVCEKNKVLETGFGASLLALSWIIIFCTMIFLTARRISAVAVAERKATQELHLHRELLETVVEHLPTGIIIIRGSDLRIIMANAAYLELAKGREVADKTLGEVWPELALYLMERCREVLASGEPFHAMDQPLLIRRSPEAPLEEGFFSWALYRVQLPGEQGYGLLNTGWETTKRMRSEQQLRDSEIRLRSIIEHLAEGLIVVDPVGGTLHWNRTALEMHNYNGEEDELAFLHNLIGKYELLTPAGEVVPVDQWPVKRLLRGEEIRDWDLVVRDKERAWQRIYSYSGGFVRDTTGKVEMGLLTIRDMTERREAEERLRESEEKFRAFFQQSAVGMARVSFTGARWIDVNDALCHMVGYSKEELLVTPWPEITHPDDLTNDLRPFNDMAAGKLSFYSIEKRFIHKDGHHVWARLTLSLVRDAQGKPDYEVAVIEDITSRKAAEEAVSRAKVELEMRVRERTQQLELAYAELEHETEERIAAVEELRKNERLLIQQSRLAAMGEMLGNIAHQWRQPLNYLGLVIQQLPAMLRLGELTSDTLGQEVAKAMRVISEMSHTIDDFSSFLQPQREKTSFNLNEAVAATVMLFEGTFRTMQVDVQITRSGELFVSGRRNEFCQVIMNILMNTRDAIRERQIQSPKIAINLFSDDGKAVVAIADNAGGIPDEIAARVFDPYFTTKGPDKGTGIGLFMSKNIMEGMNGSLSFTNTADGVEFRIEVGKEPEADRVPEK